MVPVSIEGQNLKKIKIMPRELGPHKISLFLAGHNIPGMTIEHC
jgi:hypothetical protein